MTHKLFFLEEEEQDLLWCLEMCSDSFQVDSSKATRWNPFWVFEFFTKYSIASLEELFDIYHESLKNLI
eukprot:CAMPEP_0116887426 /NCGR_PEP_ID=MMETSP0463-20121206/21906_1 /TAXON_ID=181622 /ORGANISM="Strombidinopsis sp, Strain SopsisLIS2011" /LENGTH=68 /DNA_ID=CAMNT_0004550095 /DNA_START=1907 /DNA_END=2113 /DNA_ORIENTATION=+